MTASLTFHPLGNADCTRIDLADGRKILVDYADMRNPADPNDRRCDLPKLLKEDLRTARRDHYDVVWFSHLDDDHCCGSAEFFWFERYRSHQGEGRIKMKELWVPAGAILDKDCNDSAKIIREEARYRLRQGHGVRVFSRPAHLEKWLNDNGMTLESRRHLITDAGQYVPGFSTAGPERVAFFIHSPFGWRQDANTVIDRNEDSCVFQATFLEGGRETYALFMSDINHDTISQIVDTTRRKRNEARLLWDLFKVPHHCSYKSIGPDKGTDETQPVSQVEWVHAQGRAGALMVSTSKPMPAKGSLEDYDVQPPHRQAGNRYKRVARTVDGEFKVTMEHPRQGDPRPLEIEIGPRGVTIRSSLAAAAAIVSSPARAG